MLIYGVIFVAMSALGIAIQQGPRAVLRPWPLRQGRDRDIEPVKLTLMRMMLLLGLVLVAVGLAVELLG
jgi:hypothetical protein